MRALFWGGVLAAAWVLSGCDAKKTEAPAAATADAPQLGVDVRFAALWWSQEQMEGLDPNNPPPKNTQVFLTHWEYTDPVGVPNPDVMDVVITVDNKGAQPVSNLVVTAQGAWKVGPLADETKAAWTEPVALNKSEPFEIPAASKHEIRAQVNLKQMMDSLRPEDRWPHMLRVSVDVVQSGSNSSLAKAQADFPIKAAD